MIHISQNKKIAFSAFGLFVVSFVMMALFLKNSGELGQGEANVLGARGGENEVAVEAISEEKVDFAKIVGTSKDPVVIINAEGKVEYANEKFCRMMSVKCAKFHDVLFFDFVNSKDLAGFVSTHGKLLQTGVKIDGIGPYRLLKGKNEVIVLFDAKPLLKDGKVFAVFLHIKDITEKVNELNKGKNAPTENTQDNKDLNWIENIYPNFQEIKDEVELKLMVNKLS